MTNTTTVSPFQTLRDTAQKIRERATNATGGEWYADPSIGVYAYGDDAQPTCPPVFTDHGTTNADIEHIAGFGPLVADAVANWLDMEAAMAEKRGNSTEGHTFHALAVARAYLAPVSTEDERKQWAAGDTPAEVSA
jgi:hypothetical protein